MQQLSNYRLPALALILGLLIGYWATITYAPKIESHTITVDHDVIHNQIVTHTTTVTTPAGDTHTDTTTVDTSVKTDSSVTAAKTNILLPTKLYRVGAFANTVGSSPEIEYTALVERRVWGPISVAGSLSSKWHYTIGLTYEF